MSRVAKAPIEFPKNVQVTIHERGSELTVKGPKGELTQKYNASVNISFDADDANRLVFKPAANHADGEAWAHAGTVRSLVSNMVKGVTDGFDKVLELVGVGYRAQSTGKSVNLSLGFSHPVDHQLPEGVAAETPNNTTIILRGIDKQKVGQAASDIRAYRPPEPYKGKGIKYAGEKIARKEAKKK